MQTGTFEYKDGATTCEGFVASDGKPGRKPCVLIAHQWAGLFEQEQAKAEYFAAKGYVGFAIDVYGKGVRGAHGQDNSAYMGPYLNDRARLRQRLLAAVSAAKARPDVDPNRIAIIGYCFGGLCALDVARSGTSDVKGAVSLHGLFTPPGLGAQGKISTKVLVLHGWDDPMAKPDSVLGLAQEMTAAGAAWQIHAYGHTMHAFTAQEANMPERGLQYKASADHRSWAATIAFLEEVFA
jgi:dienelactone hydrolase